MTREQFAILNRMSRDSDRKREAIRKRRERFLAQSTALERMQRVRRVRGTYAPGVRCTARCRNAAGDTCVCECAGNNHGLTPKLSSY